VNIFEALRLALSGLIANRLRSALTMLGILIGVGAVILLVAVGNGASVAVQKQIQALGSNLLIVFPGGTQTGGVRGGFGSGASLTYQDVQALSDPARAPDVVAAIPQLGARAQLTFGTQNWNTTVSGTTAAFPEVRNYTMAEGSFFTAEDVNSEKKVMVIGPTVAQNLFVNGEDPVGQSVKVNRQTYQVIGVFDSKGAAAAGTNQDDLIAMPITSAWAYLFGGRNRNVGSIYVEASSNTDAAKSQVTQILLDQHRISDPAQADFSVTSQADIAATATQTTGILTLLLGAIAAISLVVGGIGIMNIMLVTVTERTREIGIRKAIGARRRDILLQFLIESMFLSGLGGICGILVGMAGAAVLPSLVAALPAPVVSYPSVLLAFGVSVGIGLFFGIYPANRAAGLNPIEALRYE